MTTPLPSVNGGEGDRICLLEIRHFEILAVFYLHKYSQDCHLRPSENFRSLPPFVLSCLMLLELFIVTKEMNKCYNIEIISLIAFE